MGHIFHLSHVTWSVFGVYSPVFCSVLQCIRPSIYLCQLFSTVFWALTGFQDFRYCLSPFLDLFGFLDWFMFWPLSGSTVSALPPVSASGSCSLSSMVHPWQSSSILKDRNSLFSLPETHFSLISLSFISKTFTVKQEMSQRGDEVKFFRKQSSIWIFIFSLFRGTWMRINEFYSGI